MREMCADARLRSLVPAEAAARGVRTEIEVIEHGDVPRAICQAAEAANADVVCVGAHARPSAAARVMGSVTLDVLQHCRRPVLVVWPREP
jgi:nucleotide-binding universal stress UspA family protein